MLKKTLGVLILSLAFGCQASTGPSKGGEKGLLERTGLRGKSVEKIIYIGTERAECQGEALQQCLLVKEDPKDDWMLFYDEIKGFEWEKGYEYKLKVRETPIADPPC